MTIIPALYAPLAATSLVARLRAYRLPSQILPLSEDRTPFALLTDAAIARAIFLATQYPEKQGRLSSAVHSLLGLKRPVSDRYRVVEAHVQITHDSFELRDALISLGFEPDDFYRPFPASYERHFTLRFLVDSLQPARYRLLRTIVHHYSAQAVQLIERSPGVSGYLEVERYSSKWVRKYARLGGSNKHSHALRLNAFPLSAGSVRSIPYAMTDTTASTLPAATKKADLHIKLDTRLTTDMLEGSDSPITSPFRSVLQSIGFYEVITQAGSVLYTGQFMNPHHAAHLFCVLHNCSVHYYGIAEICLEICTGLWQKPLLDSSGSRYLAEVPALLELTAPFTP